jgi:hypothetical protein
LKLSREKTNKASSANLERRSNLVNSAVSSRNDSVGVQQRPTTEVRSALLQADNEGESASGGSLSTNDALFRCIRVLVVLGERRRKRKGGNCQSGQKSLVMHLGEMGAGVGRTFEKMKREANG